MRFSKNWFSIFKYWSNNQRERETKNIVSNSKIKVNRGFSLKNLCTTVTIKNEDTKILKLVRTIKGKRLAFLAVQSL